MRFQTQKMMKYFLYLLWIGAVLVNIKSVFTDFGIDNGYAIATSYRHISGDRMFLEMWEPHQTSAFLVDALLLIYRFLVPSLTGVAIYLQIMGVLLWVPIIVILYKELSKHIDRDISNLICIFLFAFRAKQTVFPEFSNMQIGFSILFFIFLVKYMCNQDKLRYLIMSAVFMCLEIISYPACIIAYVAAIGILVLYTERKGRNILVFSGVCSVLGTLYTGYFICARGLTEFIDVLSLLVEADASHTGGSMSLYQYWHVFGEGALYIAGILAIAAIIRFCFRNYRDIPLLEISGGVLLSTSGIILILLMIKGKQSGYEWHYCIVLVLLIVFGFLGYRFLIDIEKKVWLSAILISFSSFFAVAILTNCALMSVVAYLPLAASVSIISLSKFRKGISFAGAVLLFILLHRGLIMWGYSELSYNSFINEAESVIRVGPALGIICDDTTSCIYRDNVTDFERFIKWDDSLMFIKDYGDSLCYVQAGVDISISSTISSPTFDKHQIEYWKRYSYKKPTVIAIACYGGELMVQPYYYSAIFEWVEEHYDWIGDGTWWRFYRIKE